MINKQFDDILKRKLENMTDTSFSDWSDFEHKISNSNPIDSTVRNNFDSLIKQKIAGLSATAKISDWSIFEHLLDEDQLTDQILDEKVSAEMNNMRAPYRYDHWEILHENLELQKTRNQNIIEYKIIELSLLFLILLSANNLYKSLPATFEIEKPKIYASIESQFEQIQSVDEIAINIENSASIVNLIKTVDIPPVILDYEDSKSSDSREEFIVTNLTESTLDLEDDLIASIEISTINDIPLSIESNSDVTSDDPTLASNSIIHDRSAEAFEFPVVNTISSMLSYDRKIIKKAARYTPHILYPRSNSKKSISVFVGIDNNLVNSPFDNVYDVEGFRTYGIGYSAGLDYGIKKGNKEWTIGLGYSNRSYEPRIIDELTGDAVVNLFDTSLEHIEFDIFSLTSGLRYTIKESDKWSLDLGIGASAKIVASTDYTIETVSIIRDGKYVTSKVGTPRGLDLAAKPLHDGIYEGGSLQENIYLTTDISLGLQRKMSDNTFFSLRPEYSLHSFSNGIGPNNDLINNLSLNLGIQYML